jgi:acetyl esterase/lipase
MTATTTTAAQPTPPPAPGRLGDPDLTLGTDPRSDPRMVAAMTAFGLAGRAADPPVSPADPRDARLAFVAATEEGFEALFTALVAGLPPVAGVRRSTTTITGPDGGPLDLHVHAPAERPDGRVPGVLHLHLHGGGMTLLTATTPAYVRFRDELAATGLVVVGVDFRNAAGARGAHPFPAGLDDCAAALAWIDAQRADLGLSGVILAGDSGGANLALATAIRAGREGHGDRLAGVYAMMPFVSGAYGWPVERQLAELPSLVEADGYFVGNAINAVVASLYDGDGAAQDDPLCWPLRAGAQDLADLPPHVVTVDELDPFRDEGLQYHRMLARAGVEVTGRTVTGVCHGADLMFRAAMPDLYAATIADVRAFAVRVAAGG